MNAKNATQAKTLSVIYVYELLGSEFHKGCVKVGEASGLATGESDQLQTIAINRIAQQTTTVSAKVRLLAVFPAETDDGKRVRDKEVLRFLHRLGFARVSPNGSGRDQEWVFGDSQAVVRAVSEYLARHSRPSEVSLYPWQERFVSFLADTKRRAKRRNRGFDVLGNLTMRAGKTMSTLYFLSRDPDFKRVLIVTNRPNLKNGWFRDYRAVNGTTRGFYDRSRYGLLRDALRGEDRVL